MSNESERDPADAIERQQQAAARAQGEGEAAAGPGGLAPAAARELRSERLMAIVEVADAGRADAVAAGDEHLARALEDRHDIALAELHRRHQAREECDQADREAGEWQLPAASEYEPEP